MRTYGLTEDDAKAFMEPANALAIYVRRQFIEHTLFGDPARAVGPQSGLLSMMEGPSFQKLFAVNFDELCPPHAWSLLLARGLSDRVVGVDQDKNRVGRHGMTNCRCTIGAKTSETLPIDFNAVYQSVSAVDIIVPVLETFITEHEPETDRSGRCNDPGSVPQRAAVLPALGHPG